MRSFHRCLPSVLLAAIAASACAPEVDGASSPLEAAASACAPFARAADACDAFGYLAAGAYCISYIGEGEPDGPACTDTLEDYFMCLSDGSCEELKGHFDGGYPTTDCGPQLQAVGRVCDFADPSDSGGTTGG